MDASGLARAILQRPRPADWAALRQAAEARLEGQDFPTNRQEAWRHLDLAPLKALEFQPPQEAAMTAEAARDFILPEARGTRLVFVNGRFDPRHSNISALPPGMRLLRLANAPDAARGLGCIAQGEQARPDFFGDLNTARFEDGALVFVPRGVRVEAPLHVVFHSHQEGASPAFSLPRVHVLLERGAELNLVEEYAGSGTYLTNAVTEICVEEGASLRHDRIQRESPAAFHVASLRVKLAKAARYAGCTATLGAALSRQSPSVLLEGEGAELELDGLALLGESQVADTHSYIDHVLPGITSRQLHKCIVDDRARAIFNGQVMVRPGAQGTDARQASRNLLLSPEARVDTMPQLEIFADDVKCSHGAAVGQLDPEELFYLESRGLDPQAARNLLIYGFAADVLADIPVPSLRRNLRRTVMARTRTAGLEGMA